MDLRPVGAPDPRGRPPGSRIGPLGPSGMTRRGRPAERKDGQSRDPARATLRATLGAGSTRRSAAGSPESPRRSPECRPPGRYRPRNPGARWSPAPARSVCGTVTSSLRRRFGRFSGLLDGLFGRLAGLADPRFLDLRHFRRLGGHRPPGPPRRRRRRQARAGGRRGSPPYCVSSSDLSRSGGRGLGVGIGRGCTRLFLDVHPSTAAVPQSAAPTLRTGDRIPSTAHSHRAESAEIRAERWGKALDCRLNRPMPQVRKKRPDGPRGTAPAPPALTRRRSLPACAG